MKHYCFVFFCLFFFLALAFKSLMWIHRDRNALKTSSPKSKNYFFFFYEDRSAHIVLSSNGRCWSVPRWFDGLRWKWARRLPAVASAASYTIVVCLHLPRSKLPRRHGDALNRGVPVLSLCGKDRLLRLMWCWRDM